MANGTGLLRGPPTRVPRRNLQYAQVKVSLTSVNLLGTPADRSGVARASLRSKADQTIACSHSAWFIVTAASNGIRPRAGESSALGYRCMMRLI